jgi:hypothetical protein
MEFLNQLVEKIYNWDSRESKQYIAIILAFIIALIASIQILFMWRMATLDKKILLINDKRNILIKLVDRKKMIDEEKKSLQELINDNPYFKLKEYTLQLLSKKEFSGATEKTIDNVSEQSLSNGYIEQSLNGSISGLSLDNLVNILKILENNERVYLKEIKIIQMPTHVININFSLATLKKKTES